VLSVIGLGQALAELGLKPWAATTPNVFVFERAA
jgi:hypothetical protein